MLRAKDVMRIHMGHYTVPMDFPRAPHLVGAAIVVTSFFLRHPDGPILLDTGLATGHAKAEATFHPVVRPFDDALREMSVKTADVRAVAREGQPHPPYAPWVARLQELDPWRVTFAHDLAIWERGA